LIARVGNSQPPYFTQKKLLIKGIIMLKNLKNRTVPSLLLAAAVMAGCNSMPRQNVMLAEARSDYGTAQSNPNVVKLASSELKDAALALDQANAAFADRKDDEQVNKLAYLARQKIATTQEIAKRKVAEQAIIDAGKERDQVRLDQRTMEADNARMDASIAQNRVASAQIRASNAEAQTLDAQRMTAEAEARTRDLEAMLADMAATKSERGMVITLGDVLFNVNEAQLKPDGLRNVQKLAAFMTKYPQRTVLVEGFTDSTGSSAHNLELSKRRAESVRGALESMGIASDRSATRGYGESYPVAGNDTGANRQLNRRVEIILSDDQGRVVPR